MRAQTAAETTDLRYLDATRLRFEQVEAQLRLFIANECCYANVSVLRIFPLSQTDRYLSVRDGKNNEVGIITDLRELDRWSQRLINDALERRYVIPVISQITEVRERFGTVEWQVETDRGPRRFTTRNTREHSMQPSPGRFLLTDVDGNRYDVRDLDALDSASQAWIMRHV